ncbi:MAG: hypothetical protein D6683_02810 [Actinomyces sp.]|nr:MAG: hypothetical protein D6683_02810 [Actinomyces sp.]
MVESIILVDVPEGDDPVTPELLERFGHVVRICHGPEHGTLCPILEKAGHCDLVDEAHGVVFELDLDRPQHRAILARYREILREGIPLRVLVREGQDERYADLLEGVEVWTHEPGVADLDAFSARVEAYERVEHLDETE